MLRLVEDVPAGGYSERGVVVRLPRGRHGLPADLVKAHQRQRLLEAASAALDEQGYARIAAAKVIELAGVSTATFYQHFDDIWDCLGAACETEAALLCRTIEDACGDAGDDPDRRADAGIVTALDFLAAEPSVARLLSGEPPPQAEQLVAARGALVERLGEMLQGVREAGTSPPLLERRMVGAALTLVSTKVAAGEADRLLELETPIREFLLADL